MLFYTNDYGVKGEYLIILNDSYLILALFYLKINKLDV